MATSADKRIELAIEQAFTKGPLDIIDLLGTLRRRGPGWFKSQEGSIHALIHAQLKRGDWQVVGRTERGLAAYANASYDGAGPTHEPLEPQPLLPAISQAALKIARSAKDEAARGRIVSDVVAHMQDLGDEQARFGRVGAARSLLHRADRGRPLVAFENGVLAVLKRLVIHEGPWIVAAVLAFFLLKGFIGEVFQIPSESMRPSLLVGDRVVVNKLKSREFPERWRMVTFEHDGRTLVKRAVAFGGELVAIHRGDLLIDGELQVKPEDLRKLLRFPRYDWGFAEGRHKNWVREERGGADHLDLRREVLDALYADRWYHDAKAPQNRDRSVYVHDGYLELDAVRPAEGRVSLVMQRGPARRKGLRGGITSQRTRFVLTVDASGTRLTIEGTGGATEDLARSARAPTGRVTLTLSYVDGILRARAGDLDFQAATPAARLPVVPGVVLAGGAEVTRLRLDQDLHYGYGVGDMPHGVPVIVLDDDPTLWAYRVPEGTVYVLGDNPGDSRDSRARTLGTIPKDRIVGPVIFRVWPPSRWGSVR